MEQRPSWEADCRHSDGRNTRAHSLSRSPKFHYDIHKSPVLDPILIPSNSIRNLTRHFILIHF